MLVGEKGHAITGEESCNGGGERGYGSRYLGGKVMPFGDLGHASWGERSRYVERKVL